MQNNCTEHSGGEATCCTKAVCEKCYSEYGEFNFKKHIGNTEIRNAIIQEYDCCEGYSGDIYCLGCNKQISQGVKIYPTIGHHQVYTFNRNEQSVTTTCARCQMSETDILKPLDIEYIGLVDNKMYFCAVNSHPAMGYTKMSYSYSTISDNGITGSVSSKDADYIRIPNYDVIITIIMKEYTNNVNDKTPFRTVTKYFNTQTKTWVEN